MILKTAAASATKWQSAFCLLICAITLPLSAQSNPPQPTNLQCDIGHYQPERPEKWELMLRKEFADGKKTVVWHSEHDSRKSAMKACEKAMQAQEKIWKQNLKGNQK